jgi:cation transport regulator ChaC
MSVEATESTVEYYFAYGANMDPEEMEQRGKDAPAYIKKYNRSLWKDEWPLQVQAEAVGRALLKNHSLNMNKIYSKNSDVHFASVLPCKDSDVEGVLWKAGEPFMVVLDHYEGVHQGHYTREIVDVMTKTGEVFKAYVYIGHPDHCPQTNEKGRIHPSYRDTMIRGAVHFGLSEARIEELRSWPTVNK